MLRCWKWLQPKRVDRQLSSHYMLSHHECPWLRSTKILPSEGVFLVDKGNDGQTENGMDREGEEILGQSISTTTQRSMTDKKPHKEMQCNLFFYFSNITYLLLCPIQILFVLIRSQVSWIWIIFHQLVHMTCCFIEDVSTLGIASHVCLAHIIRLGINIDWTICLWNFFQSSRLEKKWFQK